MAPIFLQAASFTLAALLLSVPPAAAATYYIRTDGGTAEQCTGLADVPYPGQGTNQPCAWSHPYWALVSGSPSVWRIAGGDTLLIVNGSYQMGYGAPNTAWCSADYPWDCQLPALPSGSDEDHPTRFAGVAWDTGCSSRPELWGTERSSPIIDLTGTSHAVVACLDITDHSSCVEFHAADHAQCKRDSYPYGDWSAIGLYAADSEDVLLQDLNIHGLADAGIHAGRLANWTTRRVRVAGNGWVGWDGDIGSNSTCNGTMDFYSFTVEWNGCAETWPAQEPADCWAQPAGGYGDGLGTAATGGHWTFEDSIFRWNTSDGLDLLYLGRDGLGGQTTLRRVQSYDNAGNQVKVSGDLTMENSLIASQCGFFNGKSFAPYIGGLDPIDHCRAGGAALSLTLRPGVNVQVASNTIAGHGDCLVTVECAEDGQPCNGSETVSFLNDIFQGNEQYGEDDQTCWIWYEETGVYTPTSDYNIIHEVKDNGYLAKGPHDLTQDPMFRDAELSSFNGKLRASSPGIDSALESASPLDDLLGRSRPYGKASDRGAYENFFLSAPLCPLLLDP